MNRPGIYARKVVAAGEVEKSYSPGAGVAFSTSMQNTRLAAALSISVAFIVAGCALRPQAPGNHAYIRYWPPPERSTALRLAVKDLIDMKGIVTTAGSQHLAKNNPPAARDARCLAIARERKVQIVGKTNLTELAVGVSGINEYFGTPKNPLSTKRNRIPGGSSSGSAVAVAEGTADVAFGTDTAGSIRVPAACCGIAGLKTTYGLVSLDGVFPIAPQILDTVGPMARDVAGLVQGMDLLQRGFASRYRQAVAAQPAARGITIGRLYLSGTSPRIDQAVDAALAAKGFRVVVLDSAFKAQWDRAQKDARTVAAANAWLSDDKFTIALGVSGRTKAIFALGAFEYTANYRGALARQAEWQRALREVFKKVDFIALPTLQTLPTTIPIFGGSVAFEALALSQQNTAAVNFAGNPALALPIPVAHRAVSVTSVQLIGPRLSEAGLLNAGRLLESPR